MTQTFRSAVQLEGEIRPPSDKSLTHRAYLLAALARTPSEIRMPLRSEDCDATLRIIQQLGATVDEIDPERILIWPSERLQSPEEALDCGNSGTTMRLLSGILASEPGMECTLTGDESLSRRPMGRIANPLREMGAEIEGETAPLVIRGKALRGIRYPSPVASAQVKSCLLLAGLRASGETWVDEPALSRDHTERMLASLGIELRHDGSAVGVRGGASWEGFEVDIPADISSAAFLMVAGAILPQAKIRLNEVGVNPTRTGILDVMRAAGAAVREENPSTAMGEPVRDLFIEGGAMMRPFEIGGSLVPRLVDEIPVLAVLATQADGVTRIRDAKELRVKESDRIATVAQGLRTLGVEVTEHDDGMDIYGPVRLQGGEVHAHGDHRIAMSFAIAALIAEAPIVVHGAETIATSFPGFSKLLEGLIVA